MKEMKPSISTFPLLLFANSNTGHRKAIRYNRDKVLDFLTSKERNPREMFSALTDLQMPLVKETLILQKFVPFFEFLHHIQNPR